MHYRTVKISYGFINIQPDFPAFLLPQPFFVCWPNAQLTCLMEISRLHRCLPLSL